LVTLTLVAHYALQGCSFPPIFLPLADLGGDNLGAGATESPLRSTRLSVHRQENQSFVLVIVPFVTVRVFDLACVLLAVDRDHQFGNRPYGVQILCQMFILQSES
jgi:hypothetical protein